MEKTDQILSETKIAASKGLQNAIKKITNLANGEALIKRVQNNLNLGLMSEVEWAVEKVFIEFVKIKTTYLKSISLDEDVFIDETNGKETLAQAEDLFSDIDPDFKKWNLDVSSESKTSTKVQVLELIKDGVLKDIFESFGKNLDSICLTQHQIKDFCFKHRELMSLNSRTFFLFKVRNEYFVAIATVRLFGLHICVVPFLRNYPYSGGNYNFVVLKL